MMIHMKVQPYRPYVIFLITCVQGGPKKMPQFVLNTITLSNINQFSKFFYCQNQEKIRNNIITRDPTTPQVRRYTTLWNVRKSWFRLVCQEWGRLASSSSSQEPRLTANITVNMFSVAVYCLTSVQDASATPRPCSRTAHRHTLLGTHWCTCGVITSRSSSLTCSPKQPGLESSRFRCLGCPSADGLSTSTIHDNQPAKAGDRHWVGQTVPAFHSSCHWSVASPAWVRSPAARRTHWTFDVKTAWCDSYCR